MMNLVKRRSSSSWGFLRSHIVASGSFSSSAEDETPHQRFPFLWRIQHIFETMDPESLRRERFQSLYDRPQSLKLEPQHVVLDTFHKIPQSLRDFRAYGLLSAVQSQAFHLRYAYQLRDRGIIKADEIPFNVAYQLRDRRIVNDDEILFNVSPEVDCLKLDLLMHKSKQLNKYTPTCNTRLYAYAALSDFEGMDQFLTKMESDPRIKTNFHTYLIAANGFLQAGLADQAVKMMTKSEKLLHQYPQSYFFESLLVFYTEIIMDKAHVHRVWNLFKETGKRRFDASCYMCMISSLLKFDDLDGAEKLFEEWDLWMRTDCSFKYFGIRMPNMIFEAYSRKGLWEKAEAFMLDKILESEYEPDSASWGHLAAAFLVAGQLAKAIVCLSEAFSVSPVRWDRDIDPISLHTMYRVSSSRCYGSGEMRHEKFN